MPFVEPTTLRGDGVTLVPMTADHVGPLADAAREGEAWRIPITGIPTPDEAEEYVAVALSTEDRVPFVVLDAAGDVVGSTSYHDVLPGPRRVEIGHTWYAHRVRRTAMNTRCKLLLLDHAFDVLGCRTVGWRTDGENTTSQRAIARLDGTIRGQALRRDGTVRDTVMFSLTADEWPAARERLAALAADRGEAVTAREDLAPDA